MLRFLLKRYQHCVFLKWITKQVLDLKSSTKQRPASEQPGNILSAGNALAGRGVGSMLEAAGMSQITLPQRSTQIGGFNIVAITLLPLDCLPLDLSIPHLFCGCINP